MRGMPARGSAVRGLGLPLPPQPMPTRQGTRPLKRWSYVGVYGPELMLCVGEAWVGPLPQRWWAVALPDGTLRERTTLARGGVALERGRAEVASSRLRLSLTLNEGPTSRRWAAWRLPSGRLARATRTCSCSEATTASRSAPSPESCREGHV